MRCKRCRDSGVITHRSFHSEFERAVEPCPNCLGEGLLTKALNESGIVFVQNDQPVQQLLRQEEAADE